MELANQEELNNHNDLVKARIARSFSNNGISEAITLEDFEKSYPVDKFERYSIQALVNFREDFLKSEDASEEAFEENMQGLKSITVANGDLISEVYVKEIVKEED